MYYMKMKPTNALQRIKDRLLWCIVAVSSYIPLGHGGQEEEEEEKRGRVLLFASIQHILRELSI